MLRLFFLFMEERPVSANHIEVGADGIIAKFPGYGIVDACGTSVPAANQPGYAPGCTFRRVNGISTNDLLYVNIGTKLLCDFEPISSLVA